MSEGRGTAPFKFLKSLLPEPFWETNGPLSPGVRPGPRPIHIPRIPTDASVPCLLGDRPLPYHEVAGPFKGEGVAQQHRSGFKKTERIHQRANQPDHSLTPFIPVPPTAIR